MPTTGSDFWAAVDADFSDDAATGEEEEADEDFAALGSSVEHATDKSPATDTTSVARAFLMSFDVDCENGPNVPEFMD